jgi:hypothetical protein
MASTLAATGSSAAAGVAGGEVAGAGAVADAATRSGRISRTKPITFSSVL